MNKALQPTWEAEWIPSYSVDKVKDIKKKFLGAQEGPQERNKPQELQCPGLAGKYSRSSQLQGLFPCFPWEMLSQPDRTTAFELEHQRREERGLQERGLIPHRLSARSTHMFGSHSPSN